MQPGIKEGERVVVFEWAYSVSQPRINDVIVFRGNDKNEYVKRITAVAANRESFFVEGDNKSDSKKMPPVRKSAVIGKVVAKY